MSITGALSPVIYGKVNDIFNPKGIKYAGMLSIMLINSSANIFLWILAKLRWKKFEKKEKLVENNEQELQEVKNEDGDLEKK